MLNTLLIFNNQEENFEEKVCIIMKITVFLLVNATKLYQFKAKNSAIKPYPLCLGNISKYLQSIIYIYIYIKMDWRTMFLLIIIIMVIVTLIVIS